MSTAILQTQKSEESSLAKGEERKYGDGDIDPDKEKLAKEVSAQLEFEKQKFLGSDKIEDDSAVLRRKTKENEDTKAINDTKNMIAGSCSFLYIFT